MNSLRAAVAALTTTVFITSGCASVDAGTTSTPSSEPVYRTGSSIPVRGRTKEEKEKETPESPRATQQTQTTGTGNPGTN